MPRVGDSIAVTPPGELTIEDLRQEILRLREELAKRDFEFLRVARMNAANIIVSGGPDDPRAGHVGRDPESANIWGFIAERGFGFHARYSGPNYARFFVNATDDSGHGTPTTIIDLPEPNKLAFKGNEQATIMRLYGRGGQEVGFSTNFFTSYGCMDLFAPFRCFQYNYGGGTAGGPEADVGYNQEGFMYQRVNYGSEGITDLRIFNDGTWRSVQLYHPESEADSPFAAESVRVRESVTVEIS